MTRSKPILLAVLLLGLAPAGGCGPAVERGATPPGVTRVDRSTIKPDAEGYIPWGDAKRLILSGEVTSVTQTQGLVVTLTLKDGATYKAKEERLDEVWSFIKEHRL